MEMPDLEELESRAYGTRSDNGVLDIVIGAALTGYGLLAQIGAYVVPSYCLLLALLLNRLVVTPRVGRVRFAADRRARERMGVLLIALLILVPIPLGLALFLSGGSTSWGGAVSRNLTIIIGLFVALGMAAVAWAKSAGRFYVYAVMVLIDFAGARLFGQSHAVPAVAAGVPVLVIGIILLARFMRQNPVQVREAS